MCLTTVTTRDEARIKVKQQVWVTWAHSQLCRSPNVTTPPLSTAMWLKQRERLCHWRRTAEWRASLCLHPSRCDSAPPVTRGQWHKTCHPASQPGPQQPGSYVNVSACTDSRVGHISLNMHVHHWLERKHLCTCRAQYICVRVWVSRLTVCVCVCLSRSWNVTVTFPVGRSLTTVFICYTAHISSWGQAGWKWHLATSTLSGVLSVCLHLFLLLFSLLTPSPSEDLLLFSVLYQCKWVLLFS